MGGGTGPAALVLARPDFLSGGRGWSWLSIVHAPACGMLAN